MVKGKNKFRGKALETLWLKLEKRETSIISYIVPCFLPCHCFDHINTFPNDKFQIEFADNNFKFDENDKKFFKQVENTLGKERNCLLRAISPFPQCFQKTCTADM